MGTLSVAVPILAAEAEKSSPTFFYVAGIILAAWAVVLTAVGMSRADFPRTQGASRAVMAISAALVALTLTAAVVTGEKHEGDKAEAAGASHEPEPAEPAEPAPAPAAPEEPGTPTPTTGAETEPAAGPLELAAVGGQLAYDPKALEAKAGNVAITFSNPGAIPHDVQIEQGDKVLGGTETFMGGKQDFQVELKAGTYTFYCSVPGHRESGMEGRLTVS